MSKAPLSPGSRLDAITIVEELSRDDFGYTYRAKDERSHGTVIVQEFFPALNCERADDGVSVAAAGDTTGKTLQGWSARIFESGASTCPDQ